MDDDLTKNKQDSSTSWITIIIVGVIVLIVIIVLIYILTRSPTIHISSILPVQQSTSSSGTETLKGGSVLYIASPNNNGIKIQVPTNSKNVQGTQITIANQSQPDSSASGVITIAHLSGVTIDFSTFGDTVSAGSCGQLIGTGNNKFQRLS